MAEKPTKNSPAFGTLRPYEPGMLEGIGAQLQDFMVDRAGVSRPVARDLAGAVGFSRPEEAPLMRATDVLGGPAGVAVAGADFVEDPGLLTGIGVPLAAIPFIGGPARRALRGMGGNGGPPMDDELAEAVKAAREGRKAAAQERARIKPEAVQTIRDEEYMVDDSLTYEERLVDQGGITSVSKVRQELESIGMGKNPWSKQKVMKELNKRGVTNDQMEASGITALLDRKPNVTKEELVAQHERFAPQISVEGRTGQGTQWGEEQRIYDLAEGQSEYNPAKYVNYTETVFRNENPELAGDFRTQESHGMGGSKGSRGELAHARTSEYMEPGVGRVELIEEVQSDLFKTYQQNKDAASPAKKLEAVRTALRNNKAYAKAAAPKAEEAAKMLDDFRMRNDQYKQLGITLDNVALSLRQKSTAYQDRLDRLEYVLDKRPDDLAAINQAHNDVSVARTNLGNAWSENDNAMFEAANLASRLGDSQTSNILGKFRLDESISGQGALALSVRDAVMSARRADDILESKSVPMMSPRVVELADSPRFQEAFTKYEDVARKQRQASREAQQASALIAQNRDKMRDLSEELDRINDRTVAGINDDSVFPPNTSMDMRERIMRGDVKNREAIENRISRIEKNIRSQNTDYDKKLELADSYLSTMDNLRERMGTGSDEVAAFALSQQRSKSLDPSRLPVNPAMPFDSLNDTTQFVYETMFERAINNQSLNGVVLPDYRDVATLRGVEDEFFKMGYEDAPKAVLKRFKDRYPGIEVTQTEIPGAEFPATLIKFPKERGTDKPLIQGYAQGGLVMKGIGGLGKEVL